MKGGKAPTAEKTNQTKTRACGDGPEKSSQGVGLSDFGTSIYKNSGGETYRQWGAIPRRGSEQGGNARRSNKFGESGRALKNNKKRGLFPVAKEKHTGRDGMQRESENGN